MADSDEAVVMPEHYKVLAQKLKKVTWTIQSAFVYRPVPDGIPLDDIEAALSPLFSRAQRAAESIGIALNSIPGCQPVAEGSVSEQEIERAVDRINKQVEEFIDIFHALWKRPFPSEAAGIQPLVSAIFERILRDLLSAFQKMIDIVEHPEIIMEKYGSYTINLKITLEMDGEVARVQQWIREWKRKQSCRRRDERPRGALLAGFLFGWLLSRRKD